MTVPALEAIEVSKRYVDGDRRLVAVDRVSLVLPAGKLVALRGPSGSGKTTLLGLLGGMIAPSSGDVRVLGQSIVHLRDRQRTALRRERVGFVFQDLALVPDLTLIENVLLPLVPLGGASQAELSRADELLARVGLTSRKLARAAQLSGGERQRGAVVRALLKGPPVLLLDEPTAHLDVASAKEVVALLATLRDEGTTVVCATHDPRLADDERVDLAITMVDGRLT